MRPLLGVPCPTPVSSSLINAAKTRAALVLAAVLLLAPAAQAQNALSFFKNYFVTGDYVVGGVGMRATGVGGFATGTISMSGTSAVPVANADILAAFLYWETVETPNSGSGVTGAQFRGNDISGLAKQLNPLGTSPCWSSGGGTGGSGGAHKLFVYRADVLRFLPVGTVPNQPGFGRTLVNDSDLKAQGQAFHQVVLPDAGSGNNVPSTAGASLVVIYRDTTPGAVLRSIVIYNGGYTMDNSTQMMTQVIQGFYQASSTNPAAKMNHIVADGSVQKSERLMFGDTALNPVPPPNTIVHAPTQVGNLNPFQGADGPTTDPAWDSTKTFNPPLSTDAISATVIVDHDSFTPFDCLSWGAIIFSTTVQDTDGDGIPDRVESVSGLIDPEGRRLPNLAAMGAHPDHKDLFVEVGYMGTIVNPNDPTTFVKYGPTGAQVVDQVGHNHRPTLNVIEQLATAFKNAPVDNPDGFKGINVHVDVGNTYQLPAPTPTAQTCRDPLTWAVTCAIIPYIDDPADPSPSNKQQLARGGEFMLETKCGGLGLPLSTTCTFQDYPGTVGWKVGFQYFRDAPENPDGTQKAVADEDSCKASNTCQRFRFDPERLGFFHYTLFAHALGAPSLDDPTRPTSNSGKGDLPGGDLIVTLGRWGNKLTPPQFGASEFVTASTWMHELGHNAGRSHRGDLDPSKQEKNCNPNYLSVMSYLFQTQGLSVNGDRVIDFSRQEIQTNINETNLPAGLGTMTYWTSWYAPLSTVDQSLGTTPATRHCDGTPLSQAEKDAILLGGGMVRIEGTTNITAPSDPTAKIDWNGDLNVNNDAGLSQDVSFNGQQPDAAKLLRGSEDWPNLLLNQIGSRRNINGLSLDVSGKDDSGKDDSGKDDSGKDDSGKDDSGKDDSGKEQDFETATSVGHPPHGLKAANAIVGKSVVVNLTWQTPNVTGTTGIQNYVVYRVDGDKLTSTNFAKRTQVQDVNDTDTSATDSKATVGKTYSYFVVVVFKDGTISPRSNLATILVTK
jgi:hypothetical protein